MQRALLSLALIVGCSEEEAPDQEPVIHSAPGPEPSVAEWLDDMHVDPSTALPPGHPPVEGLEAPDAPRPDAITGTVRETMDAASYTYMELETADGLVWIAGAHTTVAVGDRVVASGAVMHDFHSSTLNRTFDRLVLADRVEIERAGAEQQAPSTAP